jgi:hypothetical protein
VQLSRVMRGVQRASGQGNLTTSRVDALGRDDGGLGATETKGPNTVKEMRQGLTGKTGYQTAAVSIIMFQSDQQDRPLWCCGAVKLMVRRKRAGIPCS